MFLSDTSITCGRCSRLLNSKALCPKTSRLPTLCTRAKYIVSPARRQFTIRPSIVCSIRRCYISTCLACVGAPFSLPHATSFPCGPPYSVSVPQPSLYFPAAWHQFPMHCSVLCMQAHERVVNKSNGFDVVAIRDCWNLWVTTFRSCPVTGGPASPMY